MREKPDNKLQDMPKAERAAVLTGMAYGSEIQSVRRSYTIEEKREMKDSIVSESIKNKDKKAEFDAIAKEFNNAFKENKKKIDVSLDNVKRGYSENEELVYLFDDQDAGVMHAYDAEGNYLSSRPLYKEEQQTKIVELTGTNN